MHINLKGMEDAEKQLEKIARGTRIMGYFEASVGSRLPYAWGIEYGRHRVSGKRARKSGGAMYITSAVNEVLSGADRDLSEGLSKVTAPGPWVIKRLGLWARRLARVNVPKGPRKKSHSYRLKKSISYYVRKKQ